MKKILFILLLFTQNTVWAQSSIEQGILLFNQKEYQQAEEILQQQSNDGSAYATFWLGVVQYKNRKHFQAGDTFLKAAQMGDPWAMGVLSGHEYYVNNPCSYLSWPCDEKWYDLAVSKWKQEAENGNGKALLQLRFFTNKWRSYIPILGRYLIDTNYVESLESGGLNAIFYISRFSNISVGEEVRYLKFAANQGYAPAMETLYYRMDIIGLDEAIKWINKAIKLGYAEAARTLYYTYSQGKTDSTGDMIIHPDPQKAYYYNRLSGALGGEEEEASRITEKMRVKDIKPNMFLDETSIDLF